MDGWTGTIAAMLLTAQTPAHASTTPPALSTIVETTAEPWLIEGAARTASGRTVLTSVHRAGLFFVGEDGGLVPFGPVDRQAMFGAVSDMARGSIWVASSPSPHDERPDAPAQLLQLDINTGDVVAAYGADGEGAMFGDVALGPDGAVYVGDGGARRLLVLRPGAAKLEPLVLLPERGSPQGMAVSPDGRWLVFANYGTGLHRIDLTEKIAVHDVSAAGALQALPAPEGVELRGLDGLARWGDKIIAVQNGARTPRLLRLTLAPDWSAITGREALIEGAPLREPTTGYIEGGDELVFVSRSQWTDFDRDGRPTSPTPAPAVVSRLSLSPELQP